MSNSTLGHTDRLAVDDAIAGRPAGDLERSCTPPVSDTIRIAPASSGIERIEATFAGDAFEPHRHDTYALGLTMTGVQTFQYRGAQRYSLPGNVIVLHPDELHDGGAATDAGLRYRMLYLPPQLLLDALGQCGGSLPFITAPVVEDADFRGHIGQALGNLDGPLDGLLLDDLLGQLADGLVRLSVGRSVAGGAPAREAVRRACDYLRAHSGRQVSSEELEAVTGLDRFTLARQFRRTLNTSPHRYLVMRRLERARAMIGSGRSLVDIALDAGFADQAHFTRHFKKSFGMTPGRWAGLCAR